jgi:hypothetical protein
MTEFDIVLTDTPNDTEEATIDGGLAEFDAEQAGSRDRRPLAERAIRRPARPSAASWAGPHSACCWSI